MTKTYFVTGTDTEVGKTFASCLILQALANAGYQVTGLKPIASDSKIDEVAGYQGLINGDAKSILESSNVKLNYKQVNPLTFADPIAPHIAAEQESVVLSCRVLSEKVMVPSADLVLIEGAGGFLTPLNQDETYADWLVEKQWPVILVVGMKLGCLNHAQLTAESIKAKGLKIAGWVANQLDINMPFYQENLEWLRSYFDEPLLAEIRYQATPETCSLQSLECLVQP